MGSVDALRRRMQAMPGVELRPSRWGADPAFWIAGREFVHCHHGEAEVRVTRRGISGALADPRVVRRSRTSDWVQVPITETDLIVRLAAIAAEANAEDRRRPRRSGPGGR